MDFAIGRCAYFTLGLMSQHCLGKVVNQKTEGDFKICWCGAVISIRKDGFVSQFCQPYDLWQVI